MGRSRFSAAALLALVLSVCGSLTPSVATAATGVSHAASCRTTRVAASVAPWVKPFGLNKLSGNGKIYALLPRYAAVRLSEGVLHHKIAWIFSPRASKTDAPVRFSARKIGGNEVGQLYSSAGPLRPRGNGGPYPTSLDVPSPGCYKLRATVGSTTYTATLRVF